MTEYERHNSIAEFEHVTTNVTVETYDASHGIFGSLLREVKELSRKKPEATMSAGKVKIINRVLEDLLTILKDEPTGKYLDALDDETLPQMSDAVLVMVQFKSALKSFRLRYYKSVSYRGDDWITKERLAKWEEEEKELQAQWEEDDHEEDEDVC